MLTEEWSFAGSGASLFGTRWMETEPTRIVVLVHGYGEHIGRYTNMARELVSNEIVVYGMDHQGHGCSDGERVLYSDIDSNVSDIDTLVDRSRAEFGSLPLVIIGHSLGGMMTARYMQVFPGKVQGAVLSSPVLGHWGVVDSFVQTGEIPGGGIDPSTLSRDSSVGSAYVADPLVYHGDFKKETLVAISECLSNISSGPKDVSTPVLWVHGTDDQLVPQRDTEAGIENLFGSNVREIVYSDARHEVFNEINRFSVYRDVVRFIKSISVS
ncbi:lysophospholipase [Pseudonocardia sulfidoxydans NBRC 16205]|uniref:Lysophospholipase n=1 Tax=Pseudonocardia sulfidoxydans NBRC 16205 TaxID=1223511 RepID=A0A511DRL7_9PSEU|nr:alpha/beta hydrolase [Pseudonocardia sulfidoxydans]GEL26863.1 lysophospholipase [Pseudonocardia sulfidoxydans NBRC 16205]